MKKFGFLGAGQLAFLTLDFCSKYDLQSHVLGPSGSPAFSKSDQFSQGDVTSFDEVFEFAKDLDLISYEIESVNLAALEKLESLNKLVYPKTSCLKIAKNKLSQKLFFKKHQIPTANFEAFDKMQDVVNSQWKSGFLKLSEGGYDGRGVLHWSSEVDTYNWDFSQPGFIEEAIAVKKELAVQVARNKDGQIACFPIVEMHFCQDTNQLDYLECTSNTGDSYRAEIQSIAQNIATNLDLIGLLAIEFFIDSNGKLLVNEMAPRSHNSGHHTLESCNISQFEQQIRAFLNLPLIEVELLHPSCMLNTIGMDLSMSEQVFGNEIKQMPGAYFHYYNKDIAKPGRKMGHITFVADTIQEARTNLLKVQQKIKTRNLV